MDNYSPTGWLVVLADFLRRVFGSNTSDYLDMLERLNVKSVATNVSKASDAFQTCPFLEESFRALPKEVIEKVLKGNVPKNLNDWARKRQEIRAYLPSIRDELRDVLRNATISKMSDVMDLAGKAIDKKASEVKSMATFPLPAVQHLSYLKNITLTGSLAAYSIHVPETLQELIELGEQMSNCLDGRSTAMRYSHRGSGIAVLRSKANQKPAFVIHVGYGGILLEMKGKANRKPNAQLAKELQKAIQVPRSKSGQSQNRDIDFARARARFFQAQLERPRRRPNVEAEVGIEDEDMDDEIPF